MKNAGEIIIGTKVDNKGLKDGLKETKSELNSFDNNENIEIKPTLNSDEIYKELEKVEEKINKLKSKDKKPFKIGDVTVTGLDATEDIDKYNELVDIQTELQQKYMEAIELEKKHTQEIENQLMTEERYKSTAEMLNQELLKQEPEVEPEIEFTESNVDSAMLKLQNQINKKKVQIQTIENQIEKEQSNINALEREIELWDTKNAELVDEYEKYAQINALKEQGVQLTSKEQEILDSGQIYGLEESFREVNNELTSMIEKQETSVSKINELNSKLNLTKLEYGELIKKQDELNNKTNKIDFNNISKGINETSNKMSKAISKAAKWALAVFSIRTAYNLIRQAVSELSQYNQQLSNQITSIRLVLAVSLEPLINRIVSLTITLLNYLNYITKAFFGLDIFARAAELATKKMADNVGSGASAAKEMKKQLAGFDEMNVLSSTDTSAGGGGGAGVSGSNFEFDLPEVEIPKWFKDLVDFIKENKDAIIAAIAGITTALELLKIKGIDPLKAIGIGVALAGLIYTIQSIKKYLDDPTFKNFLNILKGIAVIVGGIAIAFAAWPVAIGAAVALGILYIVQNFEKIIGLFDGLIQWLDKNVLGWLKEKFGKLGEVLYAPIKGFAELAKKTFSAFYGGIKSVIEGVMLIFQGKFWEGIKKIFGGLYSVMTAPLQGFIQFVKTIVTTVIGLFKSIGTKVGEVIGGAFKAVINGVLSAIESILNFPIKSINKLIGVINKIPGINLSKLSTFNLPRLASGAVINQPGRGIPIGGRAIAGEAGREGILPLTDTRAMELLGREIGKWIKINADIPVSIGNRQVGRVVKQIMANDEFAMNS